MGRGYGMGKVFYDGCAERVLDHIIYIGFWEGEKWSRGDIQNVTYIQ